MFDDIRFLFPAAVILLIVCCVALFYVQNFAQHSSATHE